MFRPIKNFITYMQKKSSSGSNASLVAANPSTIDAAEQQKMAEAATMDDSEKDATAKSDTIELPQTPNITAQAIAAGAVKADVAAVTAAAIEEDQNANDDNNIDIEMQIKSSVMLKTGAADAPAELLLTQVGGVAVVVASKTSKHAGTTVADDNVSADFQHDLTNIGSDEASQSMAAIQAADDYCSVGSAEPLTESLEEDFQTEEEDEEGEERFLEFAHDIEAFPGREIIVLHNGDLNTSLTASETQSEDPLAIDDFTEPAVLRETSASNTLDSTTSSNNDEPSTAGDMLWININDTKTSSSCSLSPPTSSGLTPNCQQQQRHSDAAAAHSKTAANNSATEENVEELRSDGSDSGLGSETSALINSLTDISQVDGGKRAQTPTHQNQYDVVRVTESTSTPMAIAPTISVTPRRPLRSNLKRRLEADDDDDDGLLSVSGTGLSRMTDATTSPSSFSSQQQLKKPKRSINFDIVQMYYFVRQQGFGCVPSAGGCTLGMAATHVASRTLTLAEHAAELRRAHRLQLQEINPRGSSSDESDESEEDYLSEGSGSDLEAETNGFLQPVSPKQRRALLKAAGVRKIDASEKAECRDIRNSREVCGCACRDFCDPETCACSQAGIKCQVDRAMFPCGCSRDACGNTVGRVEFNPQRVRIHFIHTIMRLEMENRQQQNPPTTTTSLCVGAGVYASAVAAASGNQSAAAVAAQQQIAAGNASSYYGGLQQPHSNYSSGYASPVYAGGTAAEASVSTPANYYQPQQQSHYAALSPLHHTPSAYQLDALDVSLFSAGSAATNITPAVAAAAAAGTTAAAYNELVLPAYGNVTSAVAATPANAYHHHSIGYAALQPTAYAAYHHHQATNGPVGGADLLATHHNSATLSPPPTTYSSCAVPSVPPFGAATTTAAAALYHTDCGGVVVLETTTAPSCLALGDGNGGGGGGGGIVGSSFIDLNTPIASSTRLSQQINELLQHNRHTNAALVANNNNNTIATAASTHHQQRHHHPTLSLNSRSCTTTTAASTLLTNANGNGSSCIASSSFCTASINTPPMVEELEAALMSPSLPPHKNCLSFELTAAAVPSTCIAAALRGATPALASALANGSKIAAATSPALSQANTLASPPCAAATAILSTLTTTTTTSTAATTAETRTVLSDAQQQQQQMNV